MTVCKEVIKFSPIEVIMISSILNLRSYVNTELNIVYVGKIDIPDRWESSLNGRTHELKHFSTVDLILIN